MQLNFDGTEAQKVIHAWSEAILEREYLLWRIAGGFAIAATLLSILQIRLHLQW